jgi:hypothetical protein
VADALSFLLDAPDADAMRWLHSFLEEGTVQPRITVPPDVEPVEYLLGHVHSLGGGELPRRLGTLAAKLLAEAIAQGTYRTTEPRETKTIAALFTLVEALPLSADAVEFLQDLALSGRLLKDAGLDLHLLTLRALVLHQRPRPGQIDRLIDFWRREAEDVRYAAIAIQGLLRISTPAALEMVADFVGRARTAEPQLPITNTLFVLSSELGPARELWEDFRRALGGRPDDLEAVRQVFRQTRLHQTNPVAWDALGRSDAVMADDPGTGGVWAMRFAPANSPAVARARERLGDALLAGA